jgi:hypothetical protein
MTTQIFVQGPTGPLVFNVDLRMTGLDMKVLISEHLKVPDRHIWLSYNGGMVYNHVMLVDLGLKRDDTIRYYVR